MIQSMIDKLKNKTINSNKNEILNDDICDEL